MLGLEDWSSSAISKKRRDYGAGNQGKEVLGLWVVVVKLIDCFAGWLAGWLVGWLVYWLVCLLVDCLMALTGTILCQIDLLASRR